VRDRERDYGQDGKALERLDLPSELIKRCHNQANIGLGRPRKARLAFSIRS
jgi:hypothetical protein